VVDHTHESTGRMTVEVVIKLGWRGFEGAPFNPLRMHGCSSVMFMRLLNTEVYRRNGTHPVLRSTKNMLPSAVRHGRSNVLVPALKFTFFVWEVRRSGSGESGVVVWRAARSCVLSIKKSCVHDAVGASHSDTTSCSSNGSLLSSGRHRVRSLMLRSAWMI